MAPPGPEPSHPPDEVLSRIYEKSDPCEPITAPELAETLGVSRRTALNRLRALDDAGELASKKVGGRARVYWPPYGGVEG